MSYSHFRSTGFRIEGQGIHESQRFRLDLASDVGSESYDCELTSGEMVSILYINGEEAPGRPLHMYGHDTSQDHLSIDNFQTYDLHIDDMVVIRNDYWNGPPFFELGRLLGVAIEYAA